MSVDYYKAAIRSLAPANKYMVVLGRASSYFSNLGRGFSFLARDITIPGQSLKEASINPWGFKRPGVGGLDYDQFPITFLCDADYLIYGGFKDWHKDIYNKNDLYVNYYDDYVSDISFNLLDDTLRATHIVTVKDAFPRDIQDMSMSYESADTPTEFTVTFSFWDTE
jgi:hypothetical protein